MLVDNGKKKIFNILPFLFFQLLLLGGGIVLLIASPKREAHMSCVFLTGMFMFFSGVTWLIFFLVLFPKVIFVRQPKPLLAKALKVKSEKGRVPILENFAK